jgi:hypothetical protein
VEIQFLCIQQEEERKEQGVYQKWGEKEFRHVMKIFSDSVQRSGQ